MSEAQRRAFGGDGFFFLPPPNGRNKARGSELEKKHKTISRRLD